MMLHLGMCSHASLPAEVCPPAAELHPQQSATSRTVKGSLQNQSVTPLLSWTVGRKYNERLMS